MQPVRSAGLRRQRRGQARRERVRDHAGPDHQLFGVGANRGGDVDMEPGHPITDGQPDHIRADLGDGAAEVETESDLFGQAECLLVGRDETVEVRERSGRDGDPYVTSVDRLRSGELDDRRLIGSAAAMSDFMVASLVRLTYTSIRELLSTWEDGTSKSAARPEVTP